MRFDDLHLRDGTPIYAQIIQHLKAGIAAGTVQDGDELPSRRTLSALLGVNPNTIQKAFRLLEEEGLISSRTGSKSYVCLSSEQSQAMQQQLPHTQTQDYIATMRAMGLTRSQTVALIEALWKEDTP
ncbi:GntR family transcriptional regulator [Pseudoflavonifractor sp. An85]|uniref:GntR family transcriptional regulator n=1 Tax=Pseudoflavonifractor sp. An85 TaxID=1965661 RepID=UPI001FA90404|nr:GntR family transcriptional regulator [Pseudoflavonifractor sp. An85]